MVLRGGCVDCEFLSMLGAATPAARGRSRGEEEGGAKSRVQLQRLRFVTAPLRKIMRG